MPLTINKYKQANLLKVKDNKNGTGNAKSSPKPNGPPPVEYLAEFLRCIMSHDYHLALRYLITILKYEPKHPVAKEYYTLITSKINELEKDESTESDSESSASDSEDHAELGETTSGIGETESETETEESSSSDDTTDDTSSDD